MFRWTLAGILVLAVAGALAVTTLPTRDSSAITVTAKPSSDPPWIAGSRMPRVRDGVASIRVHCGQAAPCVGTATLGNVGVPYRIAAGSDARLRFRTSRTGRTPLTWRETSGTISYDSVTLRPS